MSMKTRIYIIILFLFVGLLSAQNTLSLVNTGNDIWNVEYTTVTAIAGFQFDVDGATVNNASGGEAAIAGFMTSSNETTVLSFSLSGTSIPVGSGILVVLDLTGEPVGLSNIIISPCEILFKCSKALNLSFKCEFKLISWIFLLPRLYRQLIRPVG